MHQLETVRGIGSAGWQTTAARTRTGDLASVAAEEEMRRPMEAEHRSRAAEMLDRAGEIGVVAPGAFADIVAVNGDPLPDIKVLQNVRFVMKDGSVFKNETK